MSIETQGNALTFATIDGDAGLRAALALSRADIIDTGTDSGMKGRGGAGFPTGMKWNFCGSEKGDSLYSGSPHKYRLRNTGASPARLLVVTSPPVL